MQLASKFMMLQIAVGDMPKAKEFYEQTLGLKVITDYRQDDNHWWVELALPEGGVHIALTTLHLHMKPGTQTLYFATPDVEVFQKNLRKKGVAVSDVKDNLHGPGSGVKWFKLQDPDGNLVHVEQAQRDV